MKIARVSNYDLDDYDETFVAEGIPDARIGKDTLAGIMAAALNHAGPEDGEHYYQAVSDDYTLRKGREP